MGGYGSGWHMGPGKLSVDSVTGICIIDSYRAGKLFNSDNERVEWAQFTVRDDNGTETFRVNVAWLPCPYGSYRPLWRCPQCNRRVEWLYGLHSRVACRHCFGLCYSSQKESRQGRAIARMHRACNRLEEDEEGYFCKPKWMRWATFNKLVQQAQDAEMESLSPLLRRLGVGDLLAELKME